MVDFTMKNSASRLGTRIAVVAAVLGVGLGLTGCIQSPTPLPGGNPSATNPSGSATSDAPTPTPTPSGPKFAEDCSTLLSDAQVYDYNPNYVADPAYSPKPGSIPAAIAAHRGQTCGWINETSRTEIEIAITSLTPDQWTAAGAAAAGGTPISAAGEHGYFAVKNGLGSAQFFFGSIWLDVSSTDFATAADAQALYPIVVQNQLHAGG